MKLLFAAYDPAIRPSDGNYWVWQAAEISKGLPDRIRSQLIQHDLCREPNSLSSDDLHGGCVALDTQWCVFYRHYNGGRDLQGRPQRGILLIGFANRAEAMRQDCSKLLESNLFAEWAVQQPLAMCLAPPNTACDGHFVSESNPSGNLEQPTEVKGAASTTAAPARSEPVSRWNECQQSSPSTGFHWRIKHLNGVWSSDVDSLPDSHFQANRSGEVKDVRKFTSETNRNVPLPKRERGTHLHFPSAAQIALGLAFLVGLLVGWTVHGLLGGGMSVTHGIDLQAAQQWAKNYHSDETGKQIPRNELLRRLQSNDWGETAHKRPVSTE